MHIIINVDIFVNVLAAAILELRVLLELREICNFVAESYIYDKPPKRFDLF